MEVRTDDAARIYESHQAWPPEVAGAVAERLRAALGPPPPRDCLFLGAATGVNDVLPFARRADPEDRVWGTDVSADCLERMRAHAAREGLANVRVRAVDLRSDLDGLGRFDLTACLFVLHRLDDWRAVVPRLAARVREGGSLFVSEFAGPGGVIRLSNEGGGEGDDPVSRMIRRHFELAGPFAAELRSTFIGPARDRLSRLLEPAGVHDVPWVQRLTPADLHAKIAARAFAPFVGRPGTPETLERLRREFAREWEIPVETTETIRLYRFAG